jgi:hypothetical protein
MSHLPVENEDQSSLWFFLTVAFLGTCFQRCIDQPASDVSNHLVVALDAPAHFGDVDQFPE